MKTWQVVVLNLIALSVLPPMAGLELQDPNSVRGGAVLAAVVALTMAPMMQHLMSKKGIAPERWWLAATGMIVLTAVLKAIKPLIIRPI